LLGENVEHGLYYRLRDAGDDVELLDDVPDLGNGTSDEAIVTYAMEAGRLLPTYDDDFVVQAGTNGRLGVLYVPDESLSTATVAGIVGEVSSYCHQTEIAGIVYAGPEWL